MWEDGRYERYVPGVRDGGKPPIFGVEIDGLILDEVLCGCIEVASC
jgi:hypothetical protein